MTGYSKEEVLGKNPRLLKSGERNPKAIMLISGQRFHQAGSGKPSSFAFRASSILLPFQSVRCSAALIKFDGPY